MTEPLTWTEHKLNIDDLIPHKANPRRISKKAYERLVNDIKVYGYHNRIKVTRDGEIIGGHQRLKALKQLGWKEVDILYPNRDLTEEEYKALLIKDNLDFGEFDMDILGNNFDLKELSDFGMEKISFNLEPLPETVESKQDKEKCSLCGK